MIKTIIIDKSKTSADVILSFLKDIEGIEVINSIETITCDIDKDVDLIIFDISSKDSFETLKIIQKLKNDNKNLSFIATSYEINSKLISETLNEGVNEFLLKPLIKDVLEASIEKIKKSKNNNQIQKANTICIFSNKSCVGKTSLAVNSAYEIAKKTNENVCLLDLNFNNEDISTFLDIDENFKTEYILSNIENAPKDAVLSMIPKYKDSSLYVMSLQKNITPDIKYNNQTISMIINSLKNIFNWIIIDTQSPLDEKTTTIFHNSDMIILIGLMNMAGIRNCQKCLELFDNMGYKSDKIKLVINRYIENSEITLDDVEKTLKEVFYKIPNNYLTLVDAINIGKPVGETNPNSNIARAYQGIADEIINTNFLNLKSEKNDYNHGIFNLMRKMGE